MKAMKAGDKPMMKGALVQPRGRLVHVVALCCGGLWLLVGRFGRGGLFDLGQHPMHRESLHRYRLLELGRPLRRALSSGHVSPHRLRQRVQLLGRRRGVPHRLWTGLRSSERAAAGCPLPPCTT